MFQATETLIESSTFGGCNDKLLADTKLRFWLFELDLLVALLKNRQAAH